MCVINIDYYEIRISLQGALFALFAPLGIGNGFVSYKLKTYVGTNGKLPISFIMHTIYVNNLCTRGFKQSANTFEF